MGGSRLGCPADFSPARSPITAINADSTKITLAGCTIPFAALIRSNEPRWTEQVADPPTLKECECHGKANGRIALTF
jgi:hypothetical protein